MIWWIASGDLLQVETRSVLTNSNLPEIQIGLSVIFILPICDSILYIHTTFEKDELQHESKREVAERKGESGGEGEKGKRESKADSKNWGNCR